MRVFAAGNAALETVHSAPTNDRATNLTNDQEQTTLVAVIFMVALCNRADHYIFILFLSSFFLSFFSAPNLSSRRLDVYHTSAHGVALVLI